MEIPRPGELLRRHGLSPRKSWGQNFLHAFHVHEAIVRAAGAGPDTRVVEIGAGLGTLTMHLLAAEAEVWAIERDRDLCHVLRQELADHPRFRLFEADAVRFDYSTASDDVHPRPAVVGNLPYQLTGALLFALLDHEPRTGPWIVMVQKEVADRMCAGPGSKQYGAASVSLGRVRRISKVIDVGRSCFLPPPRVDSAVIRFDPLDAPRGEVADPEAFRKLVRACFQQRRKTLLNSLQSVGSKQEALAWCEAAGVDPKLRPERLSIEQFAALQRAREAGSAASSDDA